MYYSMFVRVFVYSLSTCPTVYCVCHCSVHSVVGTLQPSFFLSMMKKLH